MAENVLSGESLDCAWQTMFVDAVEKGQPVSKDMRYEGSGEGISRLQCTTRELRRNMTKYLRPKFLEMMPKFKAIPMLAKQYFFWYDDQNKVLEKHFDGEPGEDSMVVVYSLGAAAELVFNQTPGPLGEDESKWVIKLIRTNSMYLFLGNAHEHLVRLRDGGKTRAVFVTFLRNQDAWPSSSPGPLALYEKEECVVLTQHAHRHHASPSCCSSPSISPYLCFVQIYMNRLIYDGDFLQSNRLFYMYNM